MELKEDKIILTKDEAEAIIWENDGKNKPVEINETDTVIFIQTNYEGSSRWHNLHSVIFKYEDRFFKFRWQEAATDYQEHKIDSPTTAYEVFPVEVNKTVYKSKQPTAA